MRKLLRADGMGFRLTLFSACIILCITLILTTIGNYLYSSSMEGQSAAYSTELQNQVTKALEARIDTVHKSLETLGNSEAFQSYLNLDGTDDRLRLLLETRVRAELIAFSNSYGEYLSVLLASDGDRYVSNDSYRISRTPLNLEQWYRAAVIQAGRPALTSKPIGRNVKSWKRYSTDNVLAISQAVLDRETGEPLGVLLADLDIREISRLTDDITLAKTGFVFIMDGQGQVVYGPRSELLYRIHPKWFDSGSGNIVCAIRGREYNLIYNRSAQIDLIAVGVYDMNQTLSAVEGVLRVSWLCALAILILAGAGSLLFAASFTRPMTQLTKLMIQVRGGDLDVRFDSRCKGEVGYLGRCFNIMVGEMKKLLELVYQEQQNKREAELKILQEQIKPHFLYNTLDTIQWMAKRHNADDVVEIVHALTSLFRVSLSKGREQILLSDEMSHVKAYLYIQKTRYEDLFDYRIRCDETLLRCRVVKLILQPLVENALYHGIKEMDEYGEIVIDISREDEDTMLLSVSDSGVGMTADQCGELNALLSASQRPADLKCYGILNVNDRVRLTCGEQFGLRFRPREGGGTVAEIRHKIVLT